MSADINAALRALAHVSGLDDATLRDLAAEGGPYAWAAREVLRVRDLGREHSTNAEPRWVAS